MDWTAAARILPLTALLVACVSQRAYEKQGEQPPPARIRAVARQARNRESAARAGASRTAAFRPCWKAPAPDAAFGNEIPVSKQK